MTRTRVVVYVIRRIVRRNVIVFAPCSKSYFRIREI